MTELFEYERYDMGGFGFGLLLIALSLALWGGALFQICRRNHDFAIGMLCVLWHVTALRACLNVACAPIYVSLVSGSTFNVPLLNLRRLSIALCMPLLEGIALSLVIVLAIVLTKNRGPRIDAKCLPGVLAGLGGTILVYLSVVLMFSYQPPP